MEALVVRLAIPLVLPLWRVRVALTIFLFFRPGPSLEIPGLWLIARCQSRSGIMSCDKRAIIRRSPKKKTAFTVWWMRRRPAFVRPAGLCRLICMSRGKTDTLSSPIPLALSPN
ncbi:hypothetical protein TNCV_731611 [Trichonephila clavipes]|nr:hypothetical protein TNCV_731611 [Trichonephila clavipes]